MGDLDSILQDFSYLKSLEHRNQAPRRLNTKLYLPDPSVVHAVRHTFSNTGEDVFDRIFNRPLGHRCFKEFVLGEYGKTDSVAVALLLFHDEVKELSSEQPAEALKRATALQKKYMLAEDVQQANIWAGAQEQQGMLKAKMDKVAAAAAPDSGRHRNINLKEMFTPFLPGARTYLSQGPWTAFRSSPHWIRYCQWKHLEMNMKISEEDFDVHRILGRGGFGEVFGCRKLDTGAMFAMKKLDKRRLKSKHQESSAVHERNVLAEMHSKFVTNLKYAFHDKDTLYLILDLMEGGDLSWHLKTRGCFKEHEALFYTAEIILGLAHIHSRNMIYRDLKPANILLDATGHARISDLGLVRDMSKSLPTSECGTHGYMAPEVLLPDTPYDQGADWWSLGCVVFQLLAGFSPFRGPEKGKITKEEIDRRTHTMVIVYPESFSAEAKDLIAQLLDRNPKTRLGCRGRGAAEVRSHPWFESMDWPALVDHKLKPPIEPSKNQVNASDVYDIDRFDSWDVRGVPVTKEDNDKYYKHFDHIMSHYWQEEILGSVYEQIVKRADTLEAKQQQKIAASAVEVEVKDAVMQGYLLKRSGLLGSWTPRYVALLADRVDVRAEQRQRPARTVLLADVSEVEERVVKGAKLLVLNAKPRPLMLRALSTSDHSCWLALLKKTLAQSQNQEPPTPGAAAAPPAHRMSLHEDEVEDEEPVGALPVIAEGAELHRTISQTSHRTVPEP